MARRLAGTVALTDPETGAPVVFVAGTVPPGWAADLITNPDAWGDRVDIDPSPVAPRPDPVAPPRHGRGSGRDAWAAYAVGLGLGVDEAMSRDDIVTAVEVHQP